MSEQTGLVRQEGKLLPVVLPQNHELAKTMVKSRTYLPLVRLMSASSKPVKTKKIEADHYALTSGTDIKDLGSQVRVVPISFRYAASTLTAGPDGKKKFKSYYDLDSATFKAVQEAANKKVKDHFWGFDLLVWLVDERVFAILPLNNPTNRNVFPEFEARLGTCVVIGSVPISTEDYDWTGITATGHPGSLDTESFPGPDEVAIALSRFPLTGETTEAAPDEAGGAQEDPNAQKQTRG